MKFKLDENFGTRTQSLFRASDHDVETVYEESLSGATDEQIYHVCQAEDRCLVTLDLDFANVLRFPPKDTGGIAVIRLPRNPSLSTLEQLIRQLLKNLESMAIAGQLWIVEVGRVRVHQDWDNLG
jgi:predicted nuclease of predicted toxin-antitoxin system